ncbi:hypothetical protein KKJ01_17585 [Xenorhabdus bovienii]|uniref:Bacteriophage protein n=1 Tax=Xenorhabdus bovienii TaxID=40576 RepID=A0AAJ1N6B4_XENBV|nr:hypothetical protein [Xenorhabdus bovienii]MDE1479981.1 hypothetical protein [Xenorhabdus bovienii]MDE9511678.1 hypothetical protein [Xenorhabdus bovienii]MDE9523320.1 hypothetical protein [Xenorhabdus bovienii]
MATLVDTLLVALKLDMSGFANDANKAIQALDDLDKKAGGASTAVVKLSDDTDEATDSTRDFDQSNQDLAKSMDKLNTNLEAILGELSEYGDKTKKNKEKTQDWSKSVNVAVKALTGLFTTILVSSGLAKLVSEVSQSNDQLHFMSKNLGMNAETIKKWQNVAEMSGGSADGMAATMTNLNKSLWDLVTMGDASILPFFNALGIGVVDSYGKIRNLDDILLDMADSFSKMSRPQAYNIAKNMGLDEGTINLLLEGKDAIREHLDTQKDLVISTKEELELNRQLRKQNSVLGQQWEGLKTIVANYLIPRLLKLSTMMTGFLEYLNKHRDTALNLFKVLSVFQTAALIPVLWRVGVAMLAAFAPLLGTTGLILALAAALWVLYDDYQAWKKGGDSMLNWKEWDESITWILKRLDEFGKWFKDTTIGKWFTDSKGDLDGFKLTLGGLALFLGGPWLAGVLTSLTLAGLGLLRFFGLPGALLAGAIWAFSELKSKIDNFDWDSLAENTAKGSVKAVEAIITANKLMNAGSASEQGQILLDTAKSLPEVKLITEAVEFGSNTISSNRDKQGRINWSGVVGSTVDSFKKAAKTAANAAKNKPKSLPETQKGNTRGERNNNPLNMEFAKQKGATVEDHPEKRFAKFNTPYEGVERTAWQLRRFFNGQGKPKKLQTVADIISAWAPPGGKDKNRTEDYIDRVAQRLGVGRNDRLDLSDHDVMYALMNAMSQNEIGKLLPYSKNLVMAAIKGQGDPMVNLANNISAFSETISKPLAPNMDVNASSQFLSQTNKIQSMPATGATNIKVDMNGDVIVNSSASTITGTVSDGTEAIRTNLSQIIPSMG